MLTAISATGCESTLDVIVQDESYDLDVGFTSTPMTCSEL